MWFEESSIKPSGSLWFVVWVFFIYAQICGGVASGNNVFLKGQHELFVKLAAVDYFVEMKFQGLWDFTLIGKKNVAYVFWVVLGSTSWESWLLIEFKGPPISSIFCVTSRGLSLLGLYAWEENRFLRIENKLLGYFF